MPDGVLGKVFNVRDLLFGFCGMIRKGIRRKWLNVIFSVGKAVFKPDNYCPGVGKKLTFKAP